MVYRQTERSEKVRATRRKRILQAARHLFAKHGYPATTMRDIADSAKTSIGNLYFYFENKDALLGTLLREAREPIWEWIDTAAEPEQPGPSRMAIGLYGYVIRLLQADRDLMRLLVLDGAAVGISQRISVEHTEHWRSYWQTNFPDYPDAELELAVSLWMGGLRRCLDRCIRGELDFDPLVVAEVSTRWNLRGVGIPQEKIDEAINAANRAIKAFPLTAK